MPRCNLIEETGKKSGKGLRVPVFLEHDGRAGLVEARVGCGTIVMARADDPAGIVAGDSGKTPAIPVGGDKFFRLVKKVDGIVLAICGLKKFHDPFRIIRPKGIDIKVRFTARRFLIASSIHCHIPPFGH